MTYDLYLWKRQRATTVTSGVIFLSLAEGIECNGLANIPRRRIISAIQAQFGRDEDEWPFELDVDDKHVFIGSAGTMNAMSV